MIALFSAFNKRMVEHGDPLTVTCIELGTGTLFLTLLAPLLPHSGPAFVWPSLHDATLLTVLSFGCTLLPFALALVALRHMSAFEHLLRDWDGQQVAVRYDAELATWMFIAVHSTNGDGRSGGGTRMAVYAQPEDALADALKLSAAMTRKMAVCNVAMGGGKAVLAVPSLPSGAARTELLHRYGDFIGSLGGLYATAPDMNTSERDMDTIGERTERGLGGHKEVLDQGRIRRRLRSLGKKPVERLDPVRRRQEIDVIALADLRGLLRRVDAVVAHHQRELGP